MFEVTHPQQQHQHTLTTIFESISFQFAMSPTPPAWPHFTRRCSICIYRSKPSSTIQSVYRFVAEVFTRAVECNGEILTSLDGQYIHFLTQILIAAVRAYHLRGSNCRLCERPHSLQYNLHYLQPYTFHSLLSNFEYDELR